MTRRDERVLNFITSRPYKLHSLAKYIFRKKIRNLLRRKNILAHPATIMIRITHRCNLRCFFCGQRGEYGVYNVSGRDINSIEIGTSEWRKLIENVKHFDPYIYFTGGEPLMRDDIINLIEYASSLNLLTHINTNSTLLEKKASDLVRVGLDYISCSLDCVESLSEDITGRRESYKETVSGIGALTRARSNSKRGMPIIQVFTTINKKNQHLLFDMAKLAEGLGADVFVISFPIFTTPELERKTRELFKSELGVEPRFWKGFIADMSEIDCDIIEEEIRRIKSSKWRFVYRQIPPDTKDFSVHTHFRNPEVVHGHRSCALPWSLAVIMPNGDVATCWDHPDYIVGNILEKSFTDIWNGEKYRRFREVIKKGIFPSCSRCTGLYQ